NGQWNQADRRNDDDDADEIGFETSHPQLVISHEPFDTHADAVANLDQTAVTDLSAVGHNVDGALVRLHQGKDVAWGKATDLGQGHVEASDLEDDADRQPIERRLVNGSARQDIG